MSADKLDTKCRFEVKTLRLAAVLCIISTYFIAVTNVGFHGAFMWSYTVPFMSLVVGCSFYNGDYLKNKKYLVFMLYGLWFVFCRWLCGDVFMGVTDLLATAMLSFVLMMALPFACLMKDADKRKYLDIVCWFAVLGYAVLFALVYIGHFRGEQIVLAEGYLEFGSEIRNDVLFIKMCNSDDYPTDYIAACCFLISLYLASSNWSKKKALSVISLLLMAFFSISVVLIFCRTVLVGVCGALLLVLLIFLQRLKISRKLVWVIFGVCCVGGAVFVLFGSDHMYATVTNNYRSALARLSSFSDRNLVWGAGLKILRDQPSAFIHGFSMDEVMYKITAYDERGLGHMHSGIMEALMLTGVPGLLAVLAFSVKLIISSVRIFFARSEEVLIASKMMVVAVSVIFFMNIFDSLIFINRTNTDVVHFFFALFAGYIFETEDNLMKRRKQKNYGQQ